MRTHLAAALIPALALAVAAPAAAQKLDEKSYAAHKAFLEPKPGELAWQAIRWHPSLWGAVVEAHRLRRPVLVWAMNGHPLACT